MQEGAWQLGRRIDSSARLTPSPPSSPCLPQSTARDRYSLTDGDLKGQGSLRKANPHKRDWQPMQLFMESQVGAEGGSRGHRVCHACRAAYSVALRLLPAPSHHELTLKLPWAQLRLRLLPCRWLAWRMTSTGAPRGWSSTSRPRWMRACKPSCGWVGGWAGSATWSCYRVALLPPELPCNGNAPCASASPLVGPAANLPPSPTAPRTAPQRREEEKRREQQEGQRLQRIRQRITAAGQEGEAQRAATTAVPSDSDVEEI